MMMRLRPSRNRFFTRSTGWFLATATAFGGCLSTGNGDPADSTGETQAPPAGVAGPVLGKLTVGSGLQSVRCGDGLEKKSAADWTYFLVTPCNEQGCLSQGIATHPGNLDPWNAQDTRTVVNKKDDLLQGCQQWAAKQNAGKPRKEQQARCETESVYLGCTPDFALDDAGKTARAAFVKQASWFGKSNFSLTDNDFPLQGIDVARLPGDCFDRLTMRAPATYAKNLFFVKDGSVAAHATIFFTKAADAATFSKSLDADIPSATNTTATGGAGGDPLGGSKPAIEFGTVKENNPGLQTAEAVAKECAVMAVDFNKGKEPANQTGRCFAVDYIHDYCFLDFDNTTRVTKTTEPITTRPPGQATTPQQPATLPARQTTLSTQQPTLPTTQTILPPGTSLSIPNLAGLPTTTTP